jgi:hypothetical protein
MLTLVCSPPRSAGSNARHTRNLPHPLRARTPFGTPHTRSSNSPFETPATPFVAPAETSPLNSFAPTGRFASTQMQELTARNGSPFAPRGDFAREDFETPTEGFAQMGVREDGKERGYFETESGRAEQLQQTQTHTAVGGGTPFEGWGEFFSFILSVSLVFFRASCPSRRGVLGRCRFPASWVAGVREPERCGCLAVVSFGRTDWVPRGCATRGWMHAPSLHLSSCGARSARRGWIYALSLRRSFLLAQTGSAGDERGERMPVHIFLPPRCLWSSSGAESEEGEEMDIGAGGERDLVVVSFSGRADGYMHETFLRGPLCVAFPSLPILVDFPRFLYHCLFCSRTRYGVQPDQYPFFLHAGRVPAPPRVAPAISCVPSPFARRSGISVFHAENFLFGKTYFSLRFCVFYGRGRLAMGGGAGMYLLNDFPPFSTVPTLIQASLVFTLIRGAGTL